MAPHPRPSQSRPRNLIKPNEMGRSFLWGVHFDRKSPVTRLGPWTAKSSDTPDSSFNEKEKNRRKCTGSADWILEASQRAEKSRNLPHIKKRHPRPLSSLSPITSHSVVLPLHSSPTLETMVSCDEGRLFVFILLRLGGATSKPAQHTDSFGLKTCQYLRPFFPSFFSHPGQASALKEFLRLLPECTWCDFFTA